MDSVYNSLMNKICIWIIELFLWAIVVTFLSFLLIFFKSVQEQESNSYYLFFSDIDGLMRGSPVRLMGMQIGYVQNIKVFEDRVFVSFLVTKDDINIPKHATATVEFYGLGGSKSLEIEPAAEKTKTKDDLIITKEPYRIQDFYDVQNNIARTLVKINNSFSVMVNDEDIPKAKKSLKVSNEIKKLNSTVNQIEKREDNFIIKNNNHVKIEENKDASTKDTNE